MLKPKVPVAKEGYPFICYSAFITIISAILGYPSFSLILLAITTFILMFFRDPERIIPEGDNIVLSPADGKIIVSELVRDVRFSEDELLKISIFMNIFNVHVNRNPLSGVVRRVRHVPGAFLAADNDQAHLKNEFCAVTVTDRHNKEITFVQIAGLIARRIVCWLEPGDTIIQGRRFGLIRFGSRVDIYLPKESQTVVSPGQKVTAGETILAHLT
jgi:phosphatidylserine decarboxylase